MRIASALLLALTLSVSAFAQSAVPASSLVTVSADGAFPAVKKDKGVKPAKPLAEPRDLDASVVSGTLTVDGMIAKARLNYDIHAAYLYFFVPGTGTLVVAQDAFPGAEKQAKAFHGQMLTVSAEDHVVELTSQKDIAGGKKHDAWVRLDKGFQYSDASYPVMGFGKLRNAPYAWPGSKSAGVEVGKNSAPALPRNMMPKMAVTSSYTVVVKGNQNAR